MLIALTILDRGAQYLADVVKTAIRVIWGHIVDSDDAVMDRSCRRDGIAGLRVDADCSCGSK